MHQIVAVHRTNDRVCYPCSECSEQYSMMVSPEEAAVLSGVSARTIYRCVEAGVIHFLESSDGPLLVCVNSLPGMTGSNGDEY